MLRKLKILAVIASVLLQAAFGEERNVGLVDMAVVAEFEHYSPSEARLVAKYFRSRETGQDQRLEPSARSHLASVQKMSVEGVFSVRFFFAGDKRIGTAQSFSHFDEVLLPDAEVFTVDGIRSRKLDAHIAEVLTLATLKEPGSEEGGIFLVSETYELSEMDWKRTHHKTIKVFPREKTKVSGLRRRLRCPVPAKIKVSGTD